MPSAHEALVAEIRGFNRSYTRTIGLLEETLTRSAFTLTEARVLFEIGHRNHRVDARAGGELGFLADTFHLDEGPAASEIATDLRLDPAYLTRILKKFAAAGLTEARADEADRRRRILSLTKAGEKALAGLQAAADRDIAGLVGALPDEKLPELRSALRVMTELFDGAAVEAPQIVLRPHRVGDVGWVIQRQACLYAQEYGWSIEFEALLAEIGAGFIRDFKPGRDFCWIAERDALPVGAVFLVHENDATAKLRMLHVEEAARGHGIGARLVDECVRQARECGYERLVLWTNDVLAAARKLYERAGFKLVAEEKHHSFGKDLVGQTWELVF